MYTAEQQRAFYDLSKELLQERPLPAREAAEAVMRDLRDVILYHEWRYYVLNDPVVSDFKSTGCSSSCNRWRATTLN